MTEINTEVVDELDHDDVTRMLATQVLSGIEEINKANDVLLADETGTGLREIDKALKDGVQNEEVSSAWAAAEQLKDAYKNALDNARNLYRTQVLNLEAIETSEVDKEAVKEKRKVTVSALSLLKDYATANNKKDILDWADHVAVPQVGRAGSSVVGQKKPRAYVTVGETTYNSFGEAAKALSAALSGRDNAKVTVTSPDLVQAWENVNEASDFEYDGIAVKVTLKTTDNK